MNQNDCLAQFLHFDSVVPPGLYNASAIHCLICSFDLEEVFNVLQTRRWGPGQIRLMYQGTDRSSELGRPSGRREAGVITLDFIRSCLSEGMTFVIPALHIHQLCVRKACLRLGRELHCAVQANAYLSPPGGIGFPPHWDDHDVFAIQMAGRKLWKVDEHIAVGDTLSADTVFCSGAAEIDANAPSYMLTPGDGLFVPRGHNHCARSLDEISLHVTMAIKRWTWSDLIEAALKSALRRDTRAAQAIGLPTLLRSQLDEHDIKWVIDVLAVTIEPARLAEIMSTLGAVPEPQKG